MYISVIIPCYNEERRIGKTLARITEYFQNSSLEHEILVVDNGSRDRTREIIREYAKEHHAVRLISKQRYGKGWAVKQGMLEAKGDFRLFTDADNSTDISHLPAFIDAAEQGYEVVISSRRIEGAVLTHPQPPIRRMLGNIFAGLTHILVPLGIKDTQNGFKLFRGEAAEKIFRHQTSYYWAFDIEILALAQKFGFRIKELPITWVNDDDSKMNIKGMVRMLLEVLMIRLRLGMMKNK
jgi:dolichyl-phosphate beta-glucosyltransferase